MMNAAFADQDIQARQGLVRLYNDSRLPFKDVVVRTLEDLAPGAIIPVDVLERYEPLTPEHIQAYMEKENQKFTQAAETSRQDADAGNPARIQVPSILPVTAERFFINAKLYGYLKLITGDQKTDVVDEAIRLKARDLGVQLNVRDKAEVCKFVECTLSDERAKELLNVVELGLKSNLRFKQGNPNQDVLRQVRDGDYSTSATPYGGTDDFSIGKLVAKFTGRVSSIGRREAEDSYAEKNRTNPGRAFTPRELLDLGQNSDLLANSLEALRKINSTLAEKFCAKIRDKFLGKYKDEELEKRVKAALHKIAFVLRKERDPATRTKSKQCLNMAAEIERKLFRDIYAKATQGVGNVSENWQEVAAAQEAAFNQSSEDDQQAAAANMQRVRSIQQRVDESAATLAEAKDYDDSKGAELVKRVAKVSSALARIAAQQKFEEEGLTDLDSIYNTDYLEQYRKHLGKMTGEYRCKNPDFYVAKDAYDAPRVEEFKKIKKSISDMRREADITLKGDHEKLGKDNVARLEDIRSGADNALQPVSSSWLDEVNWFTTRHSRSEQVKHILTLREQAEDLKKKSETVFAKIKSAESPQNNQPQNMQAALQQALQGLPQQRGTAASDAAAPNTAAPNTAVPRPISTAV